VDPADELDRALGRGSKRRWRVVDIFFGDILQGLDHHGGQGMGNFQDTVGDLLINHRRVNHNPIEQYDHDASLVFSRRRAEVDFARVIERQVNETLRVGFHVKDVVFGNLRKRPDLDDFSIWGQGNADRLRGGQAFTTAARSLHINPERDLGRWL